MRFIVSVAANSESIHVHFSRACQRGVEAAGYKVGDRSDADRSFVLVLKEVADLRPFGELKTTIQED